MTELESKESEHSQFPWTPPMTPSLKDAVEFEIKMSESEAEVEGLTNHNAPSPVK